MDPITYMLFRSFPALFALTFFILFSSSAEDSQDEKSLFDLSLGELLELRIVTAASGYDQNIADAPASVSILEAEEWQAMGSRKVFEAIRHLPGTYLSLNPTSVTTPRTVIRGLSGNFGEQILLLVDGKIFQRFWSGGNFDGNRVPLAGVKRIEVIKNPGSAVYGADAFGGIINVVSYGEGEMPSTASVRHGAFDTYEASLSHKIEFLDSTFQFALDYHKTDGDDSREISSDLQTVFDSLFGTNASNAPGPLNLHNETYSLNATWFWNIIEFNIYSWASDDAGLGAGVAQALDPSGTTSQNSTTYDLSLDLSALTPEDDLKLNIGYQDIKSENYYRVLPAGTIVPIGPDGNIPLEGQPVVNIVQFPDGFIGNPGADTDHKYIRLTHTKDLFSQHKIRAEIGYEKTTINPFETKNFGPSVIDGTQLIVNGDLTNVTDTPYAFASDAYRELTYISLQDEWTIIDPLKATLGLRYDDYSDFGSTTNYRLGLVWEINDKLFLKPFIGSAYRAPSFSELLTKNNPAALGNPDLKPETIDTLETGMSLTYLPSDNLSTSLNIYRYKAENIIKFASGTNFLDAEDTNTATQIAQNIGEQNASGFEFATQWRASSKLSVDFNYSYIHSEDEDNVATPDIPQKMANFGLHWRPTEQWHLYCGNKWVADRERSSTDLRPQIDDYHWTKLSLSREFDNLRIQFTIDNLFDVDAREPSNGTIPDDYPLPSRSWIAELGYSF